MSDFIEKARALDKTATPGPWDWCDAEDFNGTNLGYWEVHEADEDDPPLADVRWGRKNAEFIASARTMLPAAVEALARVRELHAPESWESYGETGSICAECSTQDGHEWWPCETYEATKVGV